MIDILGSKAVYELFCSHPIRTFRIKPFLHHLRREAQVNVEGRRLDLQVAEEARRWHFPSSTLDQNTCVPFFGASIHSQFGRLFSVGRTVAEAEEAKSAYMQ
jgi:hypothetical protein